MFDIGFSEFIVIGLVALIVIGPERLPRVARTAGALLGRFQRYVNDVKSEVRREMEIEDLKKFQTQLTDQVRDVEQTIHNELRAAEDEARGLMADAAIADKTDAPAAVPAESLSETLTTETQIPKTAQAAEAAAAETPNAVKPG